MTLVSVTRAPQAGTADYVAKKGNIFLFATVKILRKGSHESYTATPLDFEIVTSKSVAIDSDQFGVGSELSSKGIHNVAVTFVVGFEVPASDKGLQFLWQPSLASNPDVQATWLIGNAGKTVKSFS